MKTKVILTGLIAAIAFSGAVAQEIEHDDMYFNSNDRVKLKAVRQTEQVAVASNRKDRIAEDDSNPTDSYSARNTNPEYTSRSQSKNAREEEDYYVTNYRSNQNDFNRSNNFNSWYGSSWYRPNYWSQSMYGWNSPYYGSSYGMWGNPWASSLSFYYGSSWNYGWGANNWWGNNYWDNYYGGYCPYYSYASAWTPYRSFGGGYYPTRVVVINDNDRYSGTYGKRNSRSSQLNRDTDGSNRSDGRIADGGRTRENSGGRLSDNSSREKRTEYYNSNWRNSSQSSGSFSSPSRSSYNNSSSSPSRSSWESQNRSRSSGSSFSPSPSRSSSFDSGSSNRSSGSNSSGSSSGSRSSRSRGN